MTLGRNPSLQPNARQASKRTREVEDGSFEVGIQKWMADRWMQTHPDVEPRVRGALRGVVGSEFTEPELTALEGRAIEKASFPEAIGLSSVSDNLPIILSPSQERIVERLLGRVATDDLGRRALEAYRRAREAGRIRRGR